MVINPTPSSPSKGHKCAVERKLNVYERNGLITTESSDSTSPTDGVQYHNTKDSMCLCDCVEEHQNRHGSNAFTSGADARGIYHFQWFT